MIGCCSTKVAANYPSVPYRNEPRPAYREAVTRIKQHVRTTVPVRHSKQPVFQEERCRADRQTRPEHTRRAESDIRRSTVAALRREAKAAGVTGTSGMRKDDLVEAVVEVRRGGGGRADDGDGAAGRDPMVGTSAPERNVQGSRTFDDRPLELHPPGHQE